MHRWGMIALDSHSTKSPSTSVGALRLGLSEAYSCVLCVTVREFASMSSASMPRCLTSANTRLRSWARFQLIFIAFLYSMADPGATNGWPADRQCGCRDGLE